MRSEVVFCNSLVLFFSCAADYDELLAVDQVNAELAELGVMEAQEEEYNRTSPRSKRIQLGRDYHHPSQGDLELSPAARPFVPSETGPEDDFSLMTRQGTHRALICICI